MLSREVKNLLEKILLIQTAILPIAILPFSAMDPISTPQLSVLVLGAFCLIGILVSNWKQIFTVRQKTVLVVLGLFNAAALLSALNSKSNLLSQLYGGYGRHTGYLTYLSISAILLTAVILSENSFNKKYLNVLIGSASISIIYGLIQYLGLDPVPWNNIFSPVIGFLGNPNFQSAFLSITGVPLFVQLISKRGKAKIQIVMFASLLLLLFTIYQTESRQGLLSFAAGSTAVMLIWLRSNVRKAISNVVGGMAVLVGFVVVLGIFSYGPLGDLLFRRSNSARMYYWEAAWKMTTEHPIFGVGLDNYGQWYRRTRSLDSVREFGIDSISDVAHNVFLEFSSSGGFLLGFSYFAVCFLVLRSVRRVIKEQQVFNATHSSLVGAWTAYQIQGLVSINQLTLVFLGWTLSGLLIGYEINENLQIKSSNEKVKTTRKHAVEAKLVLVIFGASSFGILVGSQPMISSVKFRQAIESANLNDIYNSARYFPAEPIRIFQVVSILRENRLEREALDTLEYGINKFPENYLLWKKLSETTGLTESEAQRINEKLKYLEPNGE